MVTRALLAFLLLRALGCSVEAGGLATDGATPDGALRDSGAGVDGTIPPRDAADATSIGDAAVIDGSPIDSGPIDAGCATDESCAAPLDEDCDGIIDEGCDWHFGRPSPLVRLHRSENHHYSPVLSTDGLRLYYYASFRDASMIPRGAIHVASRATPSDRFGAPTIVGGFEDVTPYSFTLSDDELEIIVELETGDGVPTRLFRATRTSRTASFGAREALDELASGSASRELNPHLSRDGTELLFVSNRSGRPSVHRATRTAPGMPFSTPALVDLGAADFYTPHLTRDGLTLFVSRINQIWASTRPTVADPFEAPVPVAGLPTDGRAIFPFVSQATSEIFFLSDRPWSPAIMSIWRARICRDGPCVEATVDCPVGTRSPDERHCYFVPTTSPATWDDGAAACAEDGAVLTTLHSAAELTVARSFSTADTWLGGHDRTTECDVDLTPGCLFEWVTGEPWLYAPWGSGEPNDGGGEDCAILRGARVGDDECSELEVIVCERELWPW